MTTLAFLFIAVQSENYSFVPMDSYELCERIKPHVVRGMVETINRHSYRNDLKIEARCVVFNIPDYAK